MLCFIHETREYFVGKLRRGETMGGEEVGGLIRVFKKFLPGCVRGVILRGDGEFISWESVKAAREEGFHYIFGNKVCAPPFGPAGGPWSERDGTLLSPIQGQVSSFQNRLQKAKNYIPWLLFLLSPTGKCEPYFSTG